MPASNSDSVQPIRTELFRFLSLRAPQLIEMERKQFGFVRHPSHKDSYFLRGLDELAARGRQDELARRADKFEPLSTRESVRDVAPALYDFSQQVFARRARPHHLDDVRAIEKLAVPGDPAVLRLWDNVFYQLLTERSVPTHQACVQLLIAHHLVTTVQDPKFMARIRALHDNAYPKRTATGDTALSLWIQRLMRAKLIIPRVFSKRNDSGSSGANTAGQGAAAAIHGVYQLGLGVFRRVEQEVCCYVPGEVSHVENILAREYKERHTRTLTSTEETTEESSESENELTSDTSTAQRNEMNSAVATVLNQASQTGVGVGSSFSGGFGPVTIGATASFDYGTSNSTAVSETEAITQAQDITQQALSRVVQRTSVKRVSRVLQEFEENNRHGFDNREGDQHVTGIYRWLDIVYVNRIINYGMRQMVEFVIPDPARFYVKSVRQASESKKQESKPERGEKPEAPKTLESSGIRSPVDITREELDGFAREFDVVLPDPPIETMTQGVSLLPKDDPTKARKPDPDGSKETFNFDLRITPGYRLSKADLLIRFDYHYQGTTEEATMMTGRMAGRTALFDKNHPIGIHPDNKASRNKPLSTTLVADWIYSTNLTDKVTLTLEMKNVHDFNVTGTLTFDVNDNIESQWQQDCFNALQDAYNREYAKYERDLESWKNEGKSDGGRAQKKADDDEKLTFGGSSESNRAIELREIKRLAIEMIAFPYNRAVGEDHMVVDKCKVPSVNQNAKWDTYASHAKFYEQSFEWDVMSYTFYPYYWSDRCKWEERMQLTAPSDPLFESFLQAGMARMIVPVRLGFEDAVNLYLETGSIWNGADMVIDTEDDLYVSIAEELQEPESFIEETWETRVPTTLTIIQDGSVLFEGEGLPCCGEVSDGRVNPLKSQRLRLKGRSS